MFQDSPFASHSGEIIIMLVVAALLGLWLGYLLWHRYKSMNVALQADYDKLHDKHTNLEADHASLKYKHDELEKDNRKWRTRVSSLEGEILGLRSKIEKLSEGDGSYGTAPPANPDNLTKIEGIGPKIQGLLNDGGIYTFDQLANAKTSAVQAILDAAGSRYKMHNPGSWGKQAALAAAGKWDELKKLQDILDGGK